MIFQSEVYEECEFAIVHPYLDNYQSHISGGFPSLAEEPSIPIPRSMKGLRTIRLFHLDTAAMLKLWMRIYMDTVAKQQMSPVDTAVYERAKEELSGYST